MMDLAFGLVERIMMGRDVTIPLRHAYPRVEGSSESQKHARHTHRRAHNARKMHWNTALFFACSIEHAGRESDQNSTAKAARDVQASRPSRPMAGAALLHQPSHLCRCQEAPSRLATTSSGPHVNARSIRSSRNRQKRRGLPPRRCLAPRPRWR